jgi:hypothetical protein
MKAVKTAFLILIISALVFSLAACSPSSILKKITGADIDIDKDGNIKIEGEEGDVVFGSSEWDKSKMHGLKAPEAKLDSYISTEDGTMYSFSEFSEDNAAGYIEYIKEAGFTYNTVTIDDFSFTGTNKDGLMISIMYDKESGSGTIASGKGEVPSEEDANKGSVIGGSNAKWDSEKVGGIPDPGAVITSYVSVEGDTSYTFESLGNYKDFVEQIKACGFTEDVSEADFNGTYIYSASNADGDLITFSASADMCTLSFEDY